MRKRSLQNARYAAININTTIT